jgi:hypothetical protein
VSEYASWRFEEGAGIAPGRTVLRRLGGGNRYEVCLVWDDSLYALAVADRRAAAQGEADEARPGRHLNRA